MLKRHQTRAVAYATTCITIIVIFMKLSSYNKAWTKLRSSEHHPRASNSVSETLVREVSGSESDVDLSKIRSLFKRADASADGYLTQKELAWSISTQVEKHLRNALRGNFRTFFALDTINKNGQVEWDEWLQNLKKTEGSKVAGGLNSRDMKIKIAAAKAAWSEAARSNPDALNIDEFLAFTHPESSHSWLAQNAEEIFGRHDSDGDGKITEEEYINDPFSELQEDEKEEKREEFREGMDDNKDGIVTKREMLGYLDPKHPYRASKEAQKIISRADSDGDGKLRIEEFLKVVDEFTDSKWVSPEKAFHGDL